MELKLDWIGNTFLIRSFSFPNSEAVQYVDEEAPAIVEFSDEGDDTFERFLSVTSQNDTLISSYYLNDADDNKVKITEVFEIEESTGVPAEMGDEPSSVVIEEIFDDGPQQQIANLLPPVVVTSTWSNAWLPSVP